MKRSFIFIPALATIILSLSLTGCENPPENNIDNSIPSVETPQDLPLENENIQDKSKEQESYE